jgi:hypothetical protein
VLVEQLHRRVILLVLEAALGQELFQLAAQLAKAALVEIGVAAIPLQRRIERALWVLDDAAALTR